MQIKNNKDSKGNLIVRRLINIIKNRIICVLVTVYKGKRVRIATFTDITELVQLRKQLEQEKELYKNISEKDDLTCIFNRRKFKNSLEDLIKLASRYKRPLSLVMFDIDRFKESLSKTIYSNIQLR